MKRAQLKGKVVWITGASSGIGEALAYEFSGYGVSLILSARRSEELERVKANCSNPSAVRILPFDLSDTQSLENKTNEALSFFGRIEIMIHNAGLALRDLAENTNLEVDEKILRINYLGPVAITKALLPNLKESGGTIVVVSSLSGKYGVPKLSAYSASKHALHGFFDSLRAEMINSGIRVLMVIPGIVRTPITVNAIKGDGSQNGVMEKTMEKGISPETCAKGIIKGILSNKEEIIIGGSETNTVWMNRLFPGMFRRIIRNHPLKKLKKITKPFKG